MFYWFYLYCITHAKLLLLGCGARSILDYVGQGAQGQLRLRVCGLLLAVGGGDNGGGWSV